MYNTENLHWRFHSWTNYYTHNAAIFVAFVAAPPPPPPSPPHSNPLLVPPTPPLTSSSSIPAPASAPLVVVIVVGIIVCISVKFILYISPFIHVKRVILFLTGYFSFYYIRILSYSLL